MTSICPSCREAAVAEAAYYAANSGTARSIVTGIRSLPAREGREELLRQAIQRCGYILSGYDAKLEAKRIKELLDAALSEGK